MTNYLFAGGGTAGHINPLLAVAVALGQAEPDSNIVVLGTKEGLEARLVPESGFQLLTVPKVAFPRRIDGNLFKFVPQLRTAVNQSKDVLNEYNIDAVVGFGGFASAPAYLAAKRRIPVIIHEQNRKAGMANKLGSRYSRHIGVAFEGTGLNNEQVVGMPLRPEIENFNRDILRNEAKEYFGLSDRPTLLVTGGSQGALHLNQTVESRLAEIIAAGFQIIHLIGGKNTPANFESKYYRPLKYCDRMHLAYALADLAIARAGATTVSEFAAVGLPAVYVPLPHGNGEQRLNAQDVLSAGGGLLVENSRFRPEWIDEYLLGLLSNPEKIQRMAKNSFEVGIRDGSARMIKLIQSALV